MRSLLLLLVAVAADRKPLPEYVINLDLAPEHRFDQLLEQYPQFNATVWEFYRRTTKHLGILYRLIEHRGPENEEQMKEIEGLSRISKIPMPFIQGIQAIYELGTLMVPIVNFTGPGVVGDFKTDDSLPDDWKELHNLGWHVGCTGIIAKDASDGDTVWHGRNLDFGPYDIIKDIVYVGIFTKGGKEIFRSQMVAGYTNVITSARWGPNGYFIERNTRFTDHFGGYLEVLKHIRSGRTLNGWTQRKILENVEDYETAVDMLKKAQYCSTEYNIVSGVKKGTIISKSPNGYIYQQTLGGKNAGSGDDYIIMTNFDYFYHDIREPFDTTAGGGHWIHPTRRHQASSILDKALAQNGAITKDDVFGAINAKYVRAHDTVFQSIVNIEKGIWEASQPDLTQWDLTTQPEEEEDPCHDKITTEQNCNADSRCTWCKCAALPSACFRVADAQRLPASVFDCASGAEQSVVV